MENIIKKAKRFVPFAILLILAYYIILLPIGKDNVVFRVFAAPLICLLSSVAFGLFNGMNLIYMLMAVIIYAPQIIYYKDVGSIVVGIVYLTFTFTGLYAGSAFKIVCDKKKETVAKRKKENNDWLL